MSGPKSNPSFVCPLCKYADRGASSWPCRYCIRLADMTDYFEPDDDAPDVPQTAADDPYPTAARRLMEKFSVNCGNCPATVLCMDRYVDQPKVLSDNCVDAFTFWLKRGPGA